MRNIKPKKDLSYEDFIKCFAGVYRKVTMGDSRAFHTCFVREAIDSYVFTDEQQRIEMAENATRESSIGCTIAKALLAQGYSAGDIRDQSYAMQVVVDDAESVVGDFVGALEQIGSYYDVPGYRGHTGNKFRLAHMLDGAPCIAGLLVSNDD